MTATINDSTRARGLPVFLTHQNKFPVGLLIAVLGAIPYVLTNHFPLTPPVQLTMTRWDSAIPFIPETIWIYLSEYLYFFVAYVLCRDLLNANKMLYAYFFLQLVCCAFFLAWPTTYPRELFPLPESLDPLSNFMFTQLRIADSPNNCCPSLHVSGVYLVSLVFLDDRRRVFPWIFGWATAIALATLTTKQHYIVDVVAGFGVALGLFWLVQRKMPYRHPAR